MRASRKPASKDRSGRRYIALRLLLILIVVLLALYVLPTPWAFHMGGRFSPTGEWDGYGPVQAGNGGRYLLYTQLRGGILHNHGHAGCSLTGCDTLTGTAQLCTQGGQHYTFDLTGAVHGWYTTNGSQTNINLTSGTPKQLPHGWVIAFHGVWHGAVLPIADTDNSFSEAFTPSGAIRTATSSAGARTTHGTLRYGSVTSFDRACRALAGQAP